MIKAMLLAAGKGTRLAPYTDDCPKPLLPVFGKPLIEYHLERLATAGIEQVVINVGYLGEKIRQAVGCGERFGLKIDYSIEPGEPLGVLAGVQHALPLLGEGAFLLFSSDVWFEGAIPQELLVARDESHFMLVNTAGFDAFDIDDTGHLYTKKIGHDFAGMASLQPAHLACAENDFGQWMRALSSEGKACGSLFNGRWHNVGTPEEWKKLR